MLVHGRNSALFSSSRKWSVYAFFQFDFQLLEFELKVLLLDVKIKYYIHQKDS